MRAALDLVLTQPVGVERTQDAERRHGVAAVEDVVDDALEVVPGAIGTSDVSGTDAQAARLVWARLFCFGFKGGHTAWLFTRSPSPSYT